MIGSEPFIRHVCVLACYGFRQVSYCKCRSCCVVIAVVFTGSYDFSLAYPIVKSPVLCVFVLPGAPSLISSPWP